MYKNLPKPLKLTVDFVYGAIPNIIKYGTKYSEMKNFLSKSQWWSEEEQIAHQVKQMRSLLIYSYKHVQYYKEVFDSYGFNPDAFKYLDQINVLPLLNKKIIQENFNDLLSDSFPVNKMGLSTTGGTSGNQLKFRSEKNYYQVEWPFVEHIWERAGYNPSKSRMAVLKNQTFKDGTLFYYDWRQRKLILDNFHLNDLNIKAILDKLVLDKIDFIHTYPSAILTICGYIQRTAYQMAYAPKAILVVSENIYSGQKEFIESTLNCRVFTFYGHSERLCIAGWCEHTDLYHIQSEYGYMELLDKDQNVIKNNGEQGEIVCTGFYNRAMPFIRYQTGDYSSYSKQKNCSCGRNYKLLKSIEGRWMQEVLVLKDNSRVSITALNMHSDVFNNVKAYQFYQDTIGVIVLNVVKAEHFDQEDEKKIKHEFLIKLGKSVDFIIKYVAGIEKTERGKYRYLIQKLII